MRGSTNGTSVDQRPRSSMTGGVGGRGPAVEAGSGEGRAGKATVTGARRRQPMLVLGGLLLVVVAALGGAVMFNRLSSTRSVLVAANDIAPGVVVGPSDLRVVELANIGPAAVIDTADQGLILGRATRAPIPAGTILNEELFVAGESLVPSGMSVVGAALDPGAAPGPGLVPGDRVDVLAVDRGLSGLAGDEGGEAVVLATATVWAVDNGGPAVGGRITVSVLVPLDTQTAVAQAAADNRLHLTLTGR